MRSQTLWGLAFLFYSCWYRAFMTEIHHRVAQSSTECYLSDLKNN